MDVLTYKQRVALLREKKIEHTLAKKEQNGYMDGDDYGTIPLLEGYKFTLIPNEGHDFFFGAMGNAVNFRALLNVHPVYVDPLEIMCGRWADMMPFYRGSSFEKLYPYEHLKEKQLLYGLNTGIGADAHFATEYTIGMELGFGGLLEKVRHYRELNPQNKEFYDAEEITVLAIQEFIQKHIDKIENLLLTETRPEIIATLKQMLQTNKSIISDKPKTFLEACQWVAWYNTVSRIYDRDGAGCNIDVLLLPYYEQDIKAGILDDELATFILANLLLIETHYYQLSGADENDNDMTNHVSYLILEAAHWLNTSANITIRIHDNIDPNFLRKGVEYLFTDRNAWPRFSCDRGLMQYQNNKGITKKMARDRIAVGCNWMAVPGLEYPLNDCIKINMAKVFDIAFHAMLDDDSIENSLDNLLDIMKEYTKDAVQVTADSIDWHMKHQRDVMPELVMNLMMYDTIEKGEDISACSRLKTVGIDGVGLGTIADSLAAIEQRIINEKRLTWEQLHEAIHNNFDGILGERTRLMLKSSDRYCQGNSLGDKWAKNISDMFAQSVRAHDTKCDRQLIPAWFSWSGTIAFGKQVGATADGRFAYTPVTHGANPNPGFRGDGAATAMATGIAKIQTNYGNTCPIQIEMDPKLSVQEGGIEMVETVLKTHADLGGTLININILDRDKLMAANENPLLYPDLVVRVTGFTAYFATLSPEFRQLVIDRFIDAF